MKFSFTITALIFLLSAGLGYAQETGSVKGKVRSMNGRVISEVTVTARQNDKDIKSAKSDSKGNFEINGLASGVYSFVFEQSGFGTGIKSNIEIEKKKTRDLGDNLRLAVDAGTLIIIRGVVYDASGRSLPGASVEIAKKQGDGSYKKVTQTTSSYGLDDNPEALTPGEFGFRFAGSAADYRITASFKGISTSQEVSVTNPAIYRLAITLKPADK